MTQNKVFIIAEVGSVHDGSFGNATRLIELAAKLGADAVKFQTHISEAETLRNAPMPPYFKGEPRFEYFKRTGFDQKQWTDLFACAKENNIELFSSAFSIEAVEFLEQFGIKRHKVASGEVTNTPLLEVMAKTGKQVILSSGMSNWAELDQAVNTMRPHNENIVVMQCTTAYPTPSERVGLNIIDEMRERWRLPVAFSDHTRPNYAAFAAVTRGAIMVEKHLTFSNAMYGSDAANAAEPNDFADMVRGIREIEKMLSHKIDKDDLSNYIDMKRIFEKSVVSTCDIPAGTIITAEMVACKKPGDGEIPARELGNVIGSKATTNIPADTLLKKTQIEKKKVA